MNHFSKIIYSLEIYISLLFYPSQLSTTPSLMGEILSHGKEGTIATFLSGIPLRGYHFNLSGHTQGRKKFPAHYSTVKVNTINSQEEMTTQCLSTKEFSDENVSLSHNSTCCKSDKQHSLPENTNHRCDSVPVLESFDSGSQPQIHTSEGKTFLPPELSEVEEYDNLFNHCKFTLVRKTIYNPIRYRILPHNYLHSTSDSNTPSTSHYASRPLPAKHAPILAQPSGDLGCIQQRSMSMFDFPSTSQLKGRAVQRSMSVFSESRSKAANDVPVVEHNVSQNARQQCKAKKKKLKRLDLGINFHEDSVKKKTVSGFGVCSSQMRGKPMPPVLMACNNHTTRGGSIAKSRVRRYDLVDTKAKAKGPVSLRYAQESSSSKPPSNTSSRKSVKKEAFRGEVSLKLLISNDVANIGL